MPCLHMTQNALKLIEFFQSPINKRDSHAVNCPSRYEFFITYFLIGHF
jgi:hypothetical protein